MFRGTFEPLATCLWGTGENRHVARGSNVPRNMGRYGPLSSAASHERRVLRLRSVGQAGPDPARVLRPGEGNVSRVECAAQFGSHMYVL